MGHLIRNGHKLVCYAPGDGALSFTWEFEGKAESREITREDIEELLALKRNDHLRDYVLQEVNHQWRLFAPVTRLGRNRLKTGRWIVEYSGDGGFNTVYYTVEDRHEIKNENIRGALTFFLKNEKEIGFTKQDLFAYSGTCEDFKEGTDRYFAQLAVDHLGSAVRDNSMEALISIGKSLDADEDKGGALAF